MPSSAFIPSIIPENYREHSADTQDITFLIEDNNSGQTTKLGAHKFVLALKSDVFKAQLFGALKESSDEIKIVDSSCKGYKMFLDALYGKEPSWSGLHINELVGLFYLANKYLVDSLRTAISEAINEHKVTKENIKDIFQCAENNSHLDNIVEVLYKKCYTFYGSLSVSGVTDMMLHYENKVEDIQMLVKMMAVYKLQSSELISSCKYCPCPDGKHIGQIIEQPPDLAISHGFLAKDLSIKVLADVTNIPVEKKRAEGKSNINYVINKIYQAVKQTVHQNRSEGFAERCDPRLESFMHYLVANDESVDLYRRALLEQVALQELDNEGEIGREVGRMARESINSNQTDKVVEEIVVWHRAYHQFRISVNYFALGVEKYAENIFEEALELLTISFIVNEKLAEDPPHPKSPCKVMLKSGLVKYFHLAVEALNNRLVDQFEMGEEPGVVANKVTSVLAPAIHIIQARTNRAPGGKDSVLLEEVRGRWCAINEQTLPNSKRDYWGTIFNTVVADDNSDVTNQLPNLRYPKLSDDLKLGIRYEAAMQRIMI